MKKNLKDISEVSSATELIERCDGMRKDGTCGNGYNGENHNKPCVGKKCPYRFGYYSHKTGGGYVQPCSVLPKDAASTKAAVETAIAIVGGSTYQQRVSDQYAAIEAAKDNLLRECVKFGALLTEVAYYLGEARGRGNEGEGLQAWLEENCPEVNYNTAMGYKALATKCVKMLGGGSQAVAVLQDKTEIVPPGEEAPVQVEQRFLAKRDSLFSEVTSRRDLESLYFKFMAAEGRKKIGRPKGSKADLSKRVDTNDPAACARAEWSRVIVPATQTVVLEAAAKMLTLSDVEDALIALEVLIDFLKSRKAELS